MKKSMLLALAFCAFFGGALAEDRPVMATPTIEDVNALVKAEKYNQARQTLLSISRNLVDIIFLEVMIAENQGRYGDAVLILDQLLEKAPQFDVARFRRVQMLVADKQFKRAKSELEFMKAQTNNPQEDQFFQARLDELASRKPYSVNLTFNIYPSTNIAGAAEDGKSLDIFTGEYVDLPPELQPKFGWKATLGLNASYAWNFADHHSLVFGVQANTNRYTVDTIDYDIARVNIDYVYQDGQNRFSIGPFYQKYWGDGKYYTHNITNNTADIVYRDEDLVTQGVSLGFAHNIDRKSSVNFAYKHSRNDYDDEYYDARKGYTNEIDMGYSISPNENSIWEVSFGASRYKQKGARDDYVSSSNYRAASLGVSYGYLYESNWFFKTGVDFEHKNYNDQKVAFTNIYRKENIWGLNLELRNQNWKWGETTPSLNCRLEATYSNVQDGDRDSVSCGIYMVNTF